MRLFDFGAFFFLMIFVFGAGYAVQEKHDLCKEIKFKSERCKLQKKIQEAESCCSL